MLDNLRNNFKVFVTGCLREFETGYPRSVRGRGLTTKSDIFLFFFVGMIYYK